MDNEQYESRGFFTELEHPESGIRVSYPSQLFLSSEAENSLKCPPPRIGEHNTEVYNELGLSGVEIGLLREQGII
jgi:crotonobetainyl-CoA:carnitine CoA-transferase CaiB-like acyl-CoA transferase